MVIQFWPQRVAHLMGLLLATKVLVEFLASHRTALVMLVCVWGSHVNKAFCSSAWHFKMSRIPEICKFMSGEYLIGLVVGTWLQRECGRSCLPCPHWATEILESRHVSLDHHTNRIEHVDGINVQI